MQGLSSRAHAFSVEALVGKPRSKRIKVSEEPDSSSAGNSGSDTGIFTGLHVSPVCQIKKAQHGSTRGQTDQDTPGDPDRLASIAGESEPCSGEESRRIRVELQGSELWKRFYEIGTEMIITKAGRRMFPSVRVKVRDLDPCQQYYIAMDIMPVDSKRYRYVYHSSQWMVAGNTDHSCISPRLYVHPDSPCAGETWMRQVISFDRVKLTNNEMDDKGHIILQSMHKYKPRVHVIRHDPRLDLSHIQSLPAQGVRSFSFPETQFTTVTAYQNQQITKLKIDRNPFAKGFRDPGRNRGVLDGLLESYPWRGPLSLDFKPFTIQLQGSSGSPLGSMKSLLPLSSSSSPLNPFSMSALSCPDASLHALSLPLYGCKTSSASSHPSSRAFSSLGSADRPHGPAPLPPLADHPLFSALQANKRPPHCGHHAGSAGCIFPFHGALSPPAQPSLLPQLSDTAPYCLYRYSFPLSPPQLASALSRHSAKLDEGMTGTERLLLWHPPASSHCL